MTYLIASKTAHHNTALARTATASRTPIDNRMNDSGSAIGGCGEAGAWACAWPWWA
ncbi:hypothetical protein [Bradyrhizobium sp. LHD-71]|uniref:hypothetical protein n=1 Tax=Bradyrhizobium sp. LHD-71 TaxID=3072141 RepID=UPI00280CD022|nr:hypothetical protein [Bradyrhizobium sp. LHD-71]MDQ8728950.1 hypothetical protein [Bradyrhizobium sp. LHD-71]